MSDFNIRSQLTPPKIEPEYHGYQLIGDDQFLRFSESLLSIKCTKLQGLKFSGLCVKNQKIIDLLRRIHVGFGDISEKVVLMIGTNDLLCGTSFEAMCEDLKELLKLLSKDTKTIILLTVPPVLKLKNDEDHWNRLKNFNEFIRQCRDDEKIFVGDAYAQFVVSNESLCVDDPNVEDLNSYPKPAPIRFSKWLLSSMANGGKQHQPVMPSQSPSNVNKCPPVNRVYHASLPPNERVTTTRKTARRRPYDSNRYNKDYQPPATKKRSPGTEREISAWTPFVYNMLKDIIHVSHNGFSGGKDSSRTSSRRALIPEEKRNSLFFRRSSGGDNSVSSRTHGLQRQKSRWSPKMPAANCDSFVTSSKRSFTSENLNSYHFSSSSSDSSDLFTRIPNERGCDSYSNSSRKSFTSENLNSYHFPPSSSSGNELFTRRKPAPIRECDSYSNSKLPSFEGDHSTTYIKKALSPEKKCNSSFFLTTPSSGDDDSSVASSKRVLTPETKCDSYSKTNDDPTDSPVKKIKDEVDIENADKIREECFEEYFSDDCRQPDLIHLNMRGLCALRGIIQGIIDIIDENYSWI